MLLDSQLMSPDHRGTVGDAPEKAIRVLLIFGADFDILCPSMPVLVVYHDSLLTDSGGEILEEILSGGSEFCMRRIWHDKALVLAACGMLMFIYEFLCVVGMSSSRPCRVSQG